MRVPSVITGTLEGLLKACKDIIFALANNLTFADNMQSTITTVTFNVTPDTAQSIPHNLGRIPVMYVYYGDRAGIVYASGVAWTSTTINLKCNTASLVATILIF